jgi:hypothetical protein
MHHVELLARLLCILSGTGNALAVCLTSLKEEHVVTEESKKSENLRKHENEEERNR